MHLAPQIANGDSKKTKVTTSHQVEVAVRLARQLEKVGDYESAYQALSKLWPDSEAPPEIADLDEHSKAEVLLRVGNVCGWLGSTNNLGNRQETAKDLITKSIDLFEALEHPRQVAEACADLALCYWREGAFDEARIHLERALDILKDDNSDIKACVLVRAGMVEVDARRLNKALGLYNQAAPLIEKSADHALIGAFHNEVARLFRWLGQADNVDRALIEYAAASFHFEQAGNTRYLARVENNLGFLYFTIGRYKDAHEHLNRARGFFLQLRDVGTAAQVDETRARTLLAEGRLREAERMIKNAVKVLERGGQQAVLAEALTTHGAIAARMGSHARAALLLQRAIVVAETVGDREGSGRAHLTIVEELGAHTPLRQLAEVYGSAAELLTQSQDPATSKRLIAGARQVIEALLAEERHRAVAAPDVDSWKGFSLRGEIRKLEKILIERALRDAGGSVTKASQLLGFKHHQSLIGLINSRHRELLPQRSIVRRRRHHLFSEPKRSKKKVPGASTDEQPAVLHVEDHKPVARLVKDILAGYHLQSCASGVAALELLKTETPVDVLIVDNNLPGISGLELVLRVRSIPHRRNLPILMLSSDDVEKEAWRAGVDAFLQKSEAVDQLCGTVDRLVQDRDEDT